MHAETTVSALLLFSDSLKAPMFTENSATSSTVKYSIDRNNLISGPLIAGYKVIRKGMAMIGKYVNTDTMVTETISPALPGSQYIVTAWALGNGKRSAMPAVVNVTTGDASETNLY